MPNILQLETRDTLELESGASLLLETQSMLQQITNVTNILLSPINCVVAGQQPEPRKTAMALGGAISGPLRGIFGE